MKHVEHVKAICHTCECEFDLTRKVYDQKKKHNKGGKIFCSLNCFYNSLAPQNEGRRYKETRKCQWCGKNFEFQVRREGPGEPGKFCSKHCSDKGRLNRSIVKICEKCGKEYRAGLSSAERRHYCSYECAGNAPIPVAELICQTCGKLYYSKKSSSHYCSRACQHVGAGQRLKGRRFDTVIKNCLQCGKEMELYPPSYANTRSYCSTTCVGESRKGKNYSVNKARIWWKEWKPAREAALARDNFACVDCLATTSLVVHHITDWKLTRDNSLENLVTLCRSCHTRRHKEAGRPQYIPPKKNKVVEVS